MAGTAHVCYGHAAGEMLTTVSVWRAPELARGPLSPAILSLSLSFSFLKEEEETKRKREENLRFPTLQLRRRVESFNFSAEPFDYYRRRAMSSLLCCAQKTVCQNDMDRGQFLRSFMATDRRSQQAYNMKSKAFAEMPVLIQET